MYSNCVLLCEVMPIQSAEFIQICEHYYSFLFEIVIIANGTSFINC